MYFILIVDLCILTLFLSSQTNTLSNYCKKYINTNNSKRQGFNALNIQICTYMCIKKYQYL